MNTQCQNELVTFKRTVGGQSHDVGITSVSYTHLTLPTSDLV